MSTTATAQPAVESKEQWMAREKAERAEAARHYPHVPLTDADWENAWKAQQPAPVRAQPSYRHLVGVSEHVVRAHYLKDVARCDPLSAPGNTGSGRPLFGQRRWKAGGDVEAGTMWFAALTERELQDFAVSTGRGDAQLKPENATACVGWYCDACKRWCPPPEAESAA